MQQKKLALGEAITKTYHYDSYPLSIIAAYGNEYMPWIFSNYIQLNANKNLLEKQEVFLEFYGSQGSQGFYCPYLNIQKILWSSFVNLGIDIDTYIKKHIDQDYYMYFQVDEFYVPNRVSYGKLHVVHDLMVYGYDDESNLYNIVGYQAGGIYKESTISYHDFKKAFDNNFLDKTENYWADWIFMFQYNSKAKYDFNISLVKFLIGEYLDSINTLEQNNRFSNSNNERVYGISVLNKIHEYLDYIKCGKMCFGNIPNYTLDIRVFSIVKEHKKIMVERLKYINEHVINIYDLIYSYENILDLSEQCFHLALKYNLTFSNILLERISEKIDGIRDSEKLILGRLMDRI